MPLFMRNGPLNTILPERATGVGEALVECESCAVRYAATRLGPELCNAVDRMISNAVCGASS